MVKKRRVLNSSTDWLNDFPVPLRAFLRCLVTAGGDFSAIFDLLHEARLAWTSPVPAFGQWVNYYRHHRIWEDEISDTLFPQEPGAMRVFAWFRSMKSGMRNIKGGIEQFRLLTPDEQREAISGAYSFWQEVDAASQAELEEELSGSTVPPLEAETLVRLPAFNFLLRVFLPCFIIHKCYPAHLLRKARAGDSDSLVALLTMDKALIFEPRIQAYACRLAMEEPDTFKTVIATPLNKTTPRISRKKMKTGFISLFSLAAQPFGGVDAPKVMAYFDWAHHRLTGELVDGDLPGKVHALPKTIQRKREDWSALLGLPPGQK